MARRFLSGIDLLGQLITAVNLSMNTNKILGRSSNGTGSIEEITIGTGLSLSGGTLSATGISGSPGVDPVIAGMIF